ncbi:MAG: peptidoglycan DD-metalloendopeptidase family protein [Dehalococcoidia bacterium]|nr:peptidoglycan DD-metalloendopeptidase family protein [Dehalococcoidia bacterium]
MRNIRFLLLATTASLAALIASGGPSEAAPGDLDTTFDGDGIVTTDISGNTDIAEALVLQPDGKIVAAGECAVYPFAFCLARYNANGSLDAGFDGDGMVTTLYAGDVHAKAYAVAIQGDGKIVVAGTCGVGPTWNFCLARYLPDGSLDTTFGWRGYFDTHIGADDSYVYGVAVQGDGKIVAAGWCFTRFGGSEYRSGFCLARYNSDGSLDGSFGVDGKVTTELGTGSSAGYDMAIQPDGKIVVAGSCNVGATTQFCLARYNSDGGLDADFGGGGYVATQVSAASDTAHAVAMQPDGKIVAGGYCWIVGTTWDYDLCLARYNPDGTLDASFDGDGKVTTTIGTVTDRPDLALQPNGKIVTAGTCVSGTHKFCLVRYNSDGSLDAAFGDGGKVETAVGSEDSYAYGVAVQGDGRIVAAGYCTNPTDFCLARYLGDGVATPAWRLPWAEGPEVWRYGPKGPHLAFEAGSPADGALDFIPDGQVGCSIPGGILVRAVAEGDVVKGDPNDQEGDNFIQIDHGSGWSSVYYHIADETVHITDPPTHVKAGDPLGSPSCEIGRGGDANASHVHLAFKRNGVWLSAAEWPTLSGWKLQDDGTLQRASCTVAAGNKVVCPDTPAPPLLEQTTLVGQGETTQLSIGLPPSQILMGAFVGWAGSTVDAWLTAPGGTVIDPSTTDPNVFHTKGEAFEYYEIRSPEAGDWALHLYGADVPPEGEDVTVVVSSESAASVGGIAELPRVGEDASSASNQVGLAGLPAAALVGLTAGAWYARRRFSQR